MRATEPDLTEVILTRAGVGPEGPARLERLRGRVVVVKYGGAAMVSPEGAEGFAGDLVLLHRAAVVVAATPRQQGGREQQGGGA